MAYFTKLLAILLLLFSANGTAYVMADNVPLQNQLYSMSKLSIPERTQESFYTRLKTILTNQLDPHSEGLANILLADYFVHTYDNLRAREHLNIARPFVITVNKPSLHQEYQYVDMLVLRGEGNIQEAKQIADALYRDVRESWPNNKLSDIVLERAYLNSFLYRYQDAFELMELALAHAYDSNDPFQLLETYNMFAILYGSINDYNSAVDFYSKAIELMESNPDYAFNNYLYVNLADTYREQKKYEQAQAYIDKAFSIANSTDNLALEAYANEVQGRLLVDQNKYEQALEYTLIAQQQLAETGEELSNFSIHSELAKIYLALDRLDEAEQQLQLTRTYGKHLGAKDMYYVQRLESELAYKRGNYQQAFDLINQSYENYRQQFNDNLTYVSNLSREQMDQERLAFENKLLEQQNALNEQYVLDSQKYSYMLWFLILLLLAAVAVALWIMLRYRRLAKANQEMAFTDNLTKLPNRRHVFRTLEHHHKASETGKHGYSVILFDIDYFKSINDRFGHNVGDKVIQATRYICKAVLRDTDTIGRIGGEEFLILLPDTDIKAAYNIAERLREYFEQYSFDSLAPGLKVTSSFGVTEYLPEDESLDLVINRADRLLYKAKNEGRNQVMATFA